MKYLLIALLLITINVSAQYGDAYHRPNNYLIEKNQREYGEKQREQARINTNTKSSTSANTNLDNLFNANKNAVEKEKNTPEELARKKQWDAQKKLEEEVKLKRWADEGAKWKAMMQLQQPFIDQFYNAGFRDDESQSIVKNIMSNSLNEAENKIEFYDLIPLMRTVKQNINTITYDELHEAIVALYYYAPLTSLDLIKKTEKRFKEHTSELDNLKINCMVIFSKSDYYHFQHQFVVDLYFELVKKYPNIQKEFLSNTGKNNPYLAKMWNLNTNGSYRDMSNGNKRKYDEIKKTYYGLIKEMENEKLQILYTSQSASAIYIALDQIKYDDKIEKKINLFDIATKQNPAGNQSINLYMYYKTNFYDYNYYKPTNYIFTKELIADKNIEITYNSELLYQLAEFSNDQALFLYCILICRNSNTIEKEEMRSRLLDLTQKKFVSISSVLKKYLATVFYDISLNTNKEENKKHIIQHTEFVKKMGNKVPNEQMVWVGDYISNNVLPNFLDPEIITYLRLEGKQMQEKYKSQ